MAWAQVTPLPVGGFEPVSSCEETTGKWQQSGKKLFQKNVVTEPSRLQKLIKWRRLNDAEKRFPNGLAQKCNTFFISVIIVNRSF